MLHRTKLVRPVQRYYLKQMIDVRVRPPSNPISLLIRLKLIRPPSTCTMLFIPYITLPSLQANTLNAPNSHTTLQSHLDFYSPLQNSLLLGPLPLLLPPTNPTTSSHSHTLTHISSLLTITTLLRSLPLQVSKRVSNIPRDVAVKHGLVEEELFRLGEGARGVRDACFELGTRGMDELITARSHLKESGGRVVPGEVMPLYLSAVSIQPAPTLSSAHRQGSLLT